MIQPKRGEVYWVSFDPAIGGEVRKTRPAIVLSNNTANRRLNRVVVIPVTSNIERLYPAETYIDIGEKRGKAMGDQITAVSKLRLGSKIGELSGTDLDRVGDTVLLHLGLPLSARGVN